MLRDANVRAKLNLFWRHAYSAYEEGRIDLALATFRQVKELAEEIGDPVEVEEATVWVGLCFHNLGRPEEALATTAEVLCDLEPKGMNDGGVRVRLKALRNWLWISLHYRGKLSSIAALLHRGHLFLRDAGRYSWRAILFFIESVLARYQGRLTAAISLADQAVGLDRAYHCYCGFVFSEYLRAAARFRMDAGVNDDFVRAMGKELLVESNDGISYLGEARGYQILSRSAVLQGNLAPALDYALHAAALYRGTVYKVGKIESQIGLADVFRAMGNLDKAAEAVAEAMRISAEYHSEFVRYDVLWCALEVETARLTLNNDQETATAVCRAAQRAWKASQRIDPRLNTSFNGDQVLSLWGEKIKPLLTDRGHRGDFPEA